jgi:integrase/recombinase XerD
LSWATASRLKHLEEITTADLEAFRDTWEDGPLAKKKKQQRLIGFFYYCLRLGSYTCWAVAVSAGTRRQ